MTSFYNHISWFFFCFFMFLGSLIFSLFISFSKSVLLVSFSIYSMWFISLDCSFLLDFYSSWFSSLILFISSVIMVYSYFYMSPYFKSIYFLWATFMFILSMLIVVNMSSFFYLMLGWDGLGVVSFFLIVFYQNHSSIHSGLFTLLMNRMGDGFFLVSIALMGSLSSSFSPSVGWLPVSIISVFLVLTFITKSALYPFSSWLPMAMAAPTPISALVHSSTLVTAGLYLMIRYSYIIYSNVFLMKTMVFISLFTSFYAGLNTIFEVDLKKLIALSTLSHLGFIGFSFSAGFLSLAYFHLLAHALFKSLLFMSMGDIMMALNHSQDIRYLSSGFVYTPFSIFIMYTSLLNLLGMPNLSGFFSKDLILESFSYSNFSYFLLLIMYFNVFFTYFYTYQLFNYSFSFVKVAPFQMFHWASGLHALLMLTLSVVSIFFGKIFLDYFYDYVLFLVVPLEFKFIPLFLNFLMFFYMLIFISFPNLLSSNLSFYFSNMLLLTPFVLSASSYCYLKTSYAVVKDVELGLVNSFLHNSIPSFVNSLALMIFNLLNLNFFITVVLFVVSFFLMF